MIFPGSMVQNLYLNPTVATSFRILYSRCQKFPYLSKYKYQQSNIICCMLLYVVKRKQRVESKRKERDEKREEGFAHRWSFFGCVRSLACSMLHPVVERSLWSAVWGHNWCVVRTQLSAHCLTIASAFRHKPPSRPDLSFFLNHQNPFYPVLV